MLGDREMHRQEAELLQSTARRSKSDCACQLLNNGTNLFDLIGHMPLSHGLYLPFLHCFQNTTSFTMCMISSDFRFRECNK